jgi:ribosomal protein L35AE/L33A
MEVKDDYRRVVQLRRCKYLDLRETALRLRVGGTKTVGRVLRPTSSGARGVVRTGFQEQLEPDIRPG